MKYIDRATLLCAGLAMAALLTIPAGAQTAADTYKAKCASCHAADGTGNTPIGKKLAVKDLTSGEVAKHTDAAFFEATKKGTGKMPAYENKISDDDIKALIKYIRTLGSGK